MNYKNIFFLRFDIINKLPLVIIFVKLLLTAPFYVEKLKSFAESTIQLRLLFESVRYIIMDLTKFASYSEPSNLKYMYKGGG